MATPYDKAKSIQSIVGSLGEVAASGLVRVPIERDSVPDALRKLQVQVFELSDALAATVKELESLKDVLAEKDRKLASQIRSMGIDRI